MKSVFLTQHGDESVLQYGELPTPVAGPNQVLVEIKACALNHLDLWIRRGIPTLKVKMPHILGSDISGVVAQVGAGVSHVQVGQEVVLNPGISCGHCQACLSGFDNNCREYGLLGEHLCGGYAQFIVVPSQNIIPKPENLHFVAAAAYPLTFLTSWHMLVTQCQVRPGDWVLVLAAGSGVGVAAIQIAKLYNATVIAAAGSEAKLEKAKELGADYLINYEKQNFREEVRKLTDKRGVDIVFEHVGEKTWDDSIKSLAQGGRLATCGATTGYKAVTDLRYVYFRNLKIFGNLMGSKSELWKITELFKTGKLRPVIDRVLPLTAAAEAHRILAQREQFGKVVLEIPA
ncbi:MAG: zinc-binding dehydrogenase [candidate division KSB1 bacterium]|nr:zinc-binding dehydrogenase [candidate division KSB1 bacterium]MDZ7304938.1 zinc-binding dehydrogenase [candidate division KSB1 bacterium]MDZ7311656.1 zinc-binding dehydrogenase [candidate division KSB1 bacterium]